jgi:DICT domain-containing protein
VEKHSAMLEVPGEDQVLVNVNHQDMCKFASRDDETYQKLWKRIRRIIEENRSRHSSVTNASRFMLICSLKYC